MLCDYISLNPVKKETTLWFKQRKFNVKLKYMIKDIVGLREWKEGEAWKMSPLWGWNSDLIGDDVAAEGGWQRSLLICIPEKAESAHSHRPNGKLNRMRARCGLGVKAWEAVEVLGWAGGMDTQSPWWKCQSVEGIKGDKSWESTEGLGTLGSGVDKRPEVCSVYIKRAEERWSPGWLARSMNNVENG